MIPLYILGLLRRYGPLHGYQIKKIIGEQLSDFTQIKLPTIYYHLEKMLQAGFLTSSSERTGSRPEKTTYSVTEKGADEFSGMLTGMLDFSYRPAYPSDGVFFFSDSLTDGEIARHLSVYAQKLRETLETIRLHREETLRFMPEDMRKNAAVIFNHHECHYKAELQWAEETRLIYEEDERI